MSPLFDTAPFHSFAVSPRPTGQGRPVVGRHRDGRARDGRDGGASRERRPAPGDSRRDARAVRSVPRRILSQGRRRARLSRRVRRRADRRRMAVGDDSRSLRRHRAGLAAASVIMEEINRCGGNAGAVHGQMYNMGTLLRHGSDAQKRKYLPSIAEGRLRIQSMAVTEPTAGTDTTRIKTTAVQARRPLRRQRTEGVDLARPAFGPDDPARAHDAARRGAQALGGDVDLHRRPARCHRPRPHRAADREHGQSRDQRAVLRQPGDSGRRT